MFPKFCSFHRFSALPTFSEPTVFPDFFSGPNLQISAQTPPVFLADSFKISKNRSLTKKVANWVPHLFFYMFYCIFMWQFFWNIFECLYFNFSWTWKTNLWVSKWNVSLGEKSTREGQKKSPQALPKHCTHIACMTSVWKNSLKTDSTIGFKLKKLHLGVLSDPEALTDILCAMCTGFHDLWDHFIMLFGLPLC